MSFLERAIADSLATTRDVARLSGPLEQAAGLVVRCLLSGHKVLTCGNGGSASDATHLATEILCRYQEDRPAYAAISLSANGDFMTAVCNDYTYDEVFARQVKGLGSRGDVLITFTTSGKSPNVRRALEEARAMGLQSICFLGRDGGVTRGIATIDLMAPGQNTARIQEAHQLLYHVLCEMMDEKLRLGKREC